MGFGWRKILIAVAVANLAWDLGLTMREWLAVGPDALWRGMESGTDTADGVGQLVVVNETGAELSLESIRLGGGDLLSVLDSGRAAPLAATGRGSATEIAFALRELAETGALVLRLPDGQITTIPLMLDRRRPRHCRLTVRLRRDAAETSPCVGFDPRREVGAYRWWGLFWAIY